MKKIVVTVIGADRVGIVAGVAKQLAEENVNILDRGRDLRYDPDVRYGERLIFPQGDPGSYGETGRSAGGRDPCPAR